MSQIHLLFAAVVPALAFLFVAGCRRDSEEGVVGKDAMVKFSSRLGLSFVAPSQWTAKDNGSSYTLLSPDNHAAIVGMVFTVEGSGSPSDFAEMVCSQILPEGATGWKPSDFTATRLGRYEAKRRELAPVPDSEWRSRLYVFATDRFYYAIVVQATAPVMLLNGGFYEEIAGSFRGVPE